MQKEHEVIKPIIFEKAESPIEFVEKPIVFIAKQKDENGIFQDVEVDNPDLTFHLIPTGMSVKEYEEKYRHFAKLLQGGNEAERNPVNVGHTHCDTTVIRPRSEIADATNYILNPLRKRLYVNSEGTIDYSRNDIVVEISIKEKFNVVKDIFKIKCMDIEKIVKVVGKSFPSAIIYDKSDASKVENDFREKTSQIDVTMCYTEAGWQKVGNKNVFLYRDYKMQGAEILTQLNMPSYSNYRKNDLINVWRQSLNLYNNYEVASVLSVYSFLGVTYKLFDEAGFPPHFLLFLNGKTGSLKTTLSKILFVQLSEEQYRQFPRRLDVDTPTSFERALVLAGKDTVTLIDDYKPAQSMQKKSEIANNLETIIRMVGDGSTKSRSNADLEDCRGKGVKGVVVLTGELRGKGLSSNLRCLYCELERECVNLDMVSWFQREKYAYTTLIVHFTRFLSEKWIEIVSFIQTNIEPKRRLAEKYLTERRLIDSLTILWIMSEIIGEFLVSYCGMEKRMAINEVSLMKSDMISVVARSEMLSKEENPAYVFMKAVATMIANKKIHITSERLQQIELSVLDGFEEGEYLYLLPDNVYKSVINWLRVGGMYLGIDMNQLGCLLCNEGYAVPTSNGTNKKLNYARIDVGGGRKVKFLKIPKEVIRNLQETIGEND